MHSSLPLQPNHELQAIFNNPIDYAAQPTMQGLRPLAIALLGYAVFGLSAASYQGGISFLYAAGAYPLLFVLALGIAIPALYIFHAFLGSRLQAQQFLRIGLVALVIPGILLAGLAPINWFFAVSVRSSTMIVVSNHVVLALVAFLGGNEILKLLRQLEPQQSQQETIRQNTFYVWFCLYIGLLYKMMNLLLPSTGIFGSKFPLI